MQTTAQHIKTTKPLKRPEKRPTLRELRTTCINDTKVVLGHVQNCNFENKTVEPLRSLTNSVVNQTMSTCQVNDMLY